MFKFSDTSSKKIIAVKYMTCLLFTTLASKRHVYFDQYDETTRVANHPGPFFEGCTGYSYVDTN